MHPIHAILLYVLVAREKAGQALLLPDLLDAAHHVRHHAGLQALLEELAGDHDHGAGEEGPGGADKVRVGMQGRR